MKKKEEKPIVCMISSREAMEGVVADIVQLKLDVVKETSDMEKEIAAIHKKYQPKVTALCKQIESKEVSVHLFCERNRETLFTDRKSIELLLASVGFEFTPYRVEKTISKDTWETIVTRLESVEWGADFIRQGNPAVDKNALLAARETLTPEQLNEAKIRFERDEQFFIRPKSEVAADTVVKEAA